MIVTKLLKQKGIPCIALLSMKILTELNLEMLAAVFRRQIIVPSIVQSMSNCDWTSSSIA